MLHRMTSYEAIDARKLMDLYQEGNIENAAYFYPDMEKALAVRKCEGDFLEDLRTRFFSREDSEYWILEEGGVWISALRLSRISDGLYYIEALETHPAYRRQGHGAELLNGVVEELKRRGGPFRLCDTVKKTNIPSLRTHQKCGFAIVPGAAVDYLTGETETDGRSYGMEYAFVP